MDSLLAEMVDLRIQTPPESIALDSMKIANFLRHKFNNEDAEKLIKYVDDVVKYKEIFCTRFMEIAAARQKRRVRVLDNPTDASAMTAPMAAILAADFIAEMLSRLVYCLDIKKNQAGEDDTYFSDLKKALLFLDEFVEKACQLVIRVKNDVEAPGSAYGAFDRDRIVLLDGKPCIKEDDEWVPADKTHPVFKIPGSSWTKFFMGDQPFFDSRGDTVIIDGPHTLKNILGDLRVRQRAAVFDMRHMGVPRVARQPVDYATLACTSGIDYSRVTARTRTTTTDLEDLRHFAEVIRQLRVDSLGHIRLEYLNAIFNTLAGLPARGIAVSQQTWMELSDSVTFSS